MPGQNASESFVPAGAKVLLAPVGTLFPADLAAAFDAAWKDLGLVGDDGASLDASRDTEDFNSWQVKNFRSRTRNRGYAWNFGAVQWNRLTVEAFFGGGVWTVTGVAPNQVFTYELPELTDIYEMALAFELVDGARKFRWWAKKVTLGDQDNISFADTLTPIPLSFKVLETPGVKPMLFRTNDNAFAA